MFRVVVGWNSTEFLMSQGIYTVGICCYCSHVVCHLLRRVWVVLPLAVDVSTVSRSSVEATTSNVNQALLANLAAPPLQSERDRQDMQESAGLCRACGISMFQTRCVPVTFHLLVVVDVLDLSWLYLWRHMTPPHCKWWAAAKDSTADSTPKLDGKSSDAGAADFWAPIGSIGSVQTHWELLWLSICLY